MFPRLTRNPASEKRQIPLVWGRGVSETFQNIRRVAPLCVNASPPSPSVPLSFTGLPPTTDTGRNLFLAIATHLR
jgi:hypothetical protein